MTAVLALPGPEGAQVAALRLTPAELAPPPAAPVPAALHASAPAAATNLFTGTAGSVMQVGTIGQMFLAEAEPPDESAWLWTLWTVATAARARVELRYLTVPHSPCVEAYLLIRTPGGDPDRARDLVTRCRADLPAHVAGRPVDSAVELRRVLDPFRPHPTGLAEIRKRVTGQLSSRGDRTQPWLVAITPLRPARRSWAPLWGALTGLPGHTMLSVGLAPFRIGPGLREHLKVRAAEFARLARPGLPPVHGLFGTERPPDPFALAAAPLYAEAVARYTDQAFQLRVSLAADRPLPESLVQLAAGTVSAGVPGAGFGQAPAAAVRPDPAESEAAWRNLTELGFDRLPVAHQQGLPGDALGEVERVLSAIADIGEAAAAARLPSDDAPFAGW